MKVLAVFPPNWKEINAAFNVRGKPVIFCYGSTIFNPSRIKVTPQLYEHERVHCGQQADDPAGWWRRYIADVEFRLRQELKAHQVEFEFSGGTDRDLHQIATRLASPLYGNLVSVDKAANLIGKFRHSVGNGKTAAAAGLTLPHHPS